MSGYVRCAACDARNPEGAEWCTQCFARLEDDPAAEVDPSPEDQSPEDASPAEEAARPEHAPPVAAPLTPTAASTPPLAPPDDHGGLLPHPDEEQPQPRQLESGDGRFRETPDGLEWCCDTCETWNPIERVTCSVCAQPFGATLGPPAPERPDVAPPLLVAASIVLPGLGHALLELYGQAFTRGILALVWGIGGVALFTNATGTGQSVLPAVPLLLGWIALVGTAANDALVEGGTPGTILLRGRSLLWLTIGVVGATMIAAFVGALTAVNG